MQRNFLKSTIEFKNWDVFQFVDTRIDMVTVYWKSQISKEIEKKNIKTHSLNKTKSKKTDRHHHQEKLLPCEPSHSLSILVDNPQRYSTVSSNTTIYNFITTTTASILSRCPEIAGRLPVFIIPILIPVLPSFTITNHYSNI